MPAWLGVYVDMIDGVPARRSKVAAAALAVLAAFATVVVMSVSGNEDDRAHVIEDSGTATGWVELEYQDVHVTIPKDWERRTDGDCLVVVEHWGPETTASCGSRPGLSFSGAATHDAAVESGVVSPGLDADSPAWVGYVRLGDVVVSVGDDDPAAVQRVVESVSTDGDQVIE